MNRYLLPSSTYRILLCSLFCLATVLIRSSGEAAETHRIILIDTSSSMRWVQNKDELPNKFLSQQSRIKAIKKPLKAYIKTKAKAGDTLRIYTFAKPVELHQKRKGRLVLQFDKAKLDDDLKEADEFVDNMHSIVGKGGGRPTHLYESMDKILGLATGLIKDGKKVSILIISDGTDTSEGKPFKDMAAVMKNHNATIKDLVGKVFCKIVEFKLKPGDEDALVRVKFGIKDARNLKDEEVFIEPEPEPEPKITIAAAFEVQQNKKAVKNGDVFWMIEKPLVFTLIDKTVIKKDDKKLTADETKGKFDYTWTYDPKAVDPDSNRGPIDISLGPNKHQIKLTVNEEVKDENTDTAPILNFTIKEVEIDADINGAEERQLEIPQGGQVDFNFKFDGPEGAEIEWDYGDGTKKGKEKKHIYQKPSIKGMPYKVIVEITLPNEEPIKTEVGSVKVTKLNATAVANPKNPWPGEEVKFETNAIIDDRKVKKVVWNVGGADMEPDKDGLNFALTHTFEMPGPVTVFAKITLEGLNQEQEADASIDVKKVLPKIVVKKNDLFVGEETKYTITQANGKKFPADFKAEVILPAGAGGVIKKPEEMIYFAKAGEHKVGVKITPTYPKGFKGVEKAFDNKIEDAAELTVKEIKIEIGVKAKK